MLDPDPDFCELLLVAFAKRTKALRHMTPDVRIRRGADNFGEKFEFESVRTRPHTSIRLIAWADRWCWIDARSKFKNSSWRWEFTHEGRPLVPADQLVRAVEQSLMAAWPSGDIEKLEAIWKPILATGPRSAALAQR
jgi:hypothetical protein